MVDNNDNVLIREINEDRDVELVGKLEKRCEIGSNNKGIFASIMGDPLCRIRFYPVHVMLVAELRENGELVGVVRGCIKYVGTKFGATYVKLGCILGLRVSPRHRRMGIGLKLVKSIEEWLTANGAHYTFLATEKNNVASTNLFTTKCNYVNFSSLVIFAQPVDFPMKDVSQDICIQKLQIEQAISLYNSKLKGQDIYPADMEAILKEKLSLGTWVSYFNEEEWNIDLHNKEKSDGIITRRNGCPRSWVVFSIWKSCEAYKIRIRKSHPLKFFHATLSHAREKICHCLKKMPTSDHHHSSLETFGFLFLFGLHGEGQRVGELMKSMWNYASELARNIKDCKVVITELGVSDPLTEFMPPQEESCMSCVNDMWYLKKIINNDENDDQVMMMMGQQVGNVFVDPRDF